MKIEFSPSFFEQFKDEIYFDLIEESKFLCLESKVQGTRQVFTFKLIEEELEVVYHDFWVFGVGFDAGFVETFQEKFYFESVLS